MGSQLPPPAPIAKAYTQIIAIEESGVIIRRIEVPIACKRTVIRKAYLTWIMSHNQPKMNLAKELIRPIIPRTDAAAIGEIKVS